MLTLTAALLLATTQTVYKCDFNGTAIYSQKPCADDAEKVEMKLPQTISGGKSAPTEQPITQRQKAIDDLDQISLNIKKRNLNIELTKATARKERLLKRRDIELQKLKAQKARSANNLAGATWEESISTEMAAITQKYETDVNELNREIDLIKAELAKLE